MGTKIKLVTNSAGRKVPTMVNGVKSTPFKGVGKFTPKGMKASSPIRACQDYPTSGNKVVKTLKEALKKCGIKNGMTISNHHHFRNGDLVMNQVFNIAANMGVKNLRWFPSASFRSHGGRWQAIQDGEVHIDIAIIAAPTADAFGNCTGDRGPSACGLLGFGLADTLYADHVIVVTDNLVDFPCIPWQIQGNNVDHVVVLDKIGEPEKIVSGTTRLTKSPDRLYIAELTAKFVKEAGIMKDGFSFQAGAGGTALAFAIYLREYMKEENIKARFIRAGSTKYLVEMLENGLTDYILDGQTFDLEGVRSMRENSGHINTSPFTSYNWHGKGNFASILDAVVLGATEVDLHFNANVVTHSDGKMLHGIGGWQNCLFSKCTILPIPSFRNRIPIIVDKVTTLVGPGELIDVIVTERGIAINPNRKDLIKATKNSGLPIRKIEEIKHEVDNLVGAPMDKPRFTDEIVGVVKWVDGTIIDSIFQTESK